MAMAMAPSNPVRRLVELLLPWFDPVRERRRDRHTEAIRLRSIASRKRAEKVIAEYRQATDAAGQAGERVIDEVRHDS